MLKINKLSVSIIVVILAALVVPTIFAQDGDDQPYAGTTVTVFGAYTDPSEVGDFNDGFAQFEEDTGIDVVYEGASDFEILINTRVEAGDPPDIAGFPQPGLMMRFADDAVDVLSFLDESYLQEKYNRAGSTWRRPSMVR